MLLCSPSHSPPSSSSAQIPPLSLSPIWVPSFLSLQSLTSSSRSLSFLSLISPSLPCLFYSKLTSTSTSSSHSVFQSVFLKNLATFPLSFLPFLLSSFNDFNSLDSPIGTLILCDSLWLRSDFPSSNFPTNKHHTHTHTDRQTQTQTHDEREHLIKLPYSSLIINNSPSIYAHLSHGYQSLCLPLCALSDISYLIPRLSSAVALITAGYHCSHCNLCLCLLLLGRCLSSGLRPNLLPPFPLSAICWVLTQIYHSLIYSFAYCIYQIRWLSYCSTCTLNMLDVVSREVW